jgi:hypothetical protein
MKRRIARASMLFLLLVTTFFYPLLAPTPHRIDQAHADRIAVGMTRTQVEAIFGVPAGQYDWAEQDPSTRAWLSIVRIYTSRRWETVAVGESVAVEPVWQEGSVFFNSDGSVVPVRLWPGIAQHSLTWTGRHGSFTIWFDQHDNVTSTRGRNEVRVVPPWQRWWRSVWNK